MTNQQKDDEFEGLMKIPSIKEWASEFSNPRTVRKYLSRLVKFFEATNKTVFDIEKMDAKELKHLLLQYQSSAKQDNQKNNSVLSNITAVRSYAGSMNKTIKFRKRQLVNIEADNDSHIFTNGDLKTMFDVGNTTEKAILATASSLGWEISMFLELERDKTRRLIEHAKANNEKFIFFEDTREKTGEPRLAVFNPLAVEWISKYLESSPESRKLFDYMPDAIHKMLNRLAVDGRLKTTGSIRFHNIRKWLMSRLSRCGFNEFQIKFMIGKSIGISDRTYLQTLRSEIEEKYPRVYNDYLNIVPILNTNKEELEKLLKLKTEFDTTKAQLADIISEQQKDKEKLEKQLSSLQNDVAEIQEFQKDMRHFEKGGATVIYHASSGFLPEDLGKIADESLTKQRQGLQSEIQKIDDILKQRKKT